MRNISLYVHVPFCKRRCPYCTFYHVSHIDKQEDAFVDALLAEWGAAVGDIGEPFRCPTVFFGGGTPSTLEGRSLDRIFDAIAPYLEGVTDREITIEANPEDVTPELLDRLQRCGVNRLSLGVQSMRREALRTLHRCAPDVNRRAIETTREHFANYSVDLLIGVPDMPPGGMHDTIEQILEYAPPHLSVYCLEPGGAMKSDQTFFDRVDGERSADEYLAVCETLRSRGYAHYEISNFARPGFESRHNRVYWRGAEYLGVGPGAHSFVDGERFHNAPSITRYVAQVRPLATRLPDIRGNDERLLEAHMLALRTSDGLAVDRVGREVVDELVAAELATVMGERMVLSDRGFLVLNEIVMRVAAAASPRGEALTPDHP